MRKYSFLFWISISFVFGKTLTDKRTSLVWQDEKIEKMSHQKAVLFCKDLNLNGYSDWRLPNIDELKSIVDYNFRDPAILQIFESVPLGYYWSSTKGSDSLFWIVDFVEGDDTWHHKTNKYFVRCVRG
jgi:hypothetical protein